MDPAPPQPHEVNRDVEEVPPLADIDQPSPVLGGKARLDEAVGMAIGGTVIPSDIRPSDMPSSTKLDAEKAPNTVNSFVFLAQQDYFDGIIFHRVIDNFVIQGGDPTGTGGGGPGYQTADEPNEVRNLKYTVSMAKVGGQAVFGSQFFINLKDNPSLDFDNPTVNKYYPFGKVVSGQDVVDAIGKVPTAAGDKPIDPVTITDVEITETAK